MPGGPEELDEAFELLRSNPVRSLEICQRYVAAHPNDADGYFSRSNAWEQLGENEKALADVNKGLELEPNSGAYSIRGKFFHEIGEYDRAIEDSSAGARRMGMEDIARSPRSGRLLCKAWPPGRGACRL
jgi:tetratricopeptide (TPR) repeat protein